MARLGLPGGAGFSLVAASLWLRVGAGLRKGLDRSGGSRHGWVCGARPGCRSMLRRSGFEAGRFPKGPRPEQEVSGRLGLRGAATILHLCVIHARCFLRVDRASRREHRGDEMRLLRAVILLLRGTVHEKGESLPTRRVPKPRWTQDSAFARGSPNDAALVTGSRSERSILRPLTHERRTLRPPEPRSESPTDPGPIRRSRPFRRPTRLAATATQPQVEAPPAEAQPQGKTHPRERSSERSPTPSNAAAEQSPAERLSSSEDRQLPTGTEPGRTRRSAPRGCAGAPR